MVRGRRPNGALPETKALKQQRDFRAKRAEKMAELESANQILQEQNKALQEANRQLGLENQLLRDHLVSAETASTIAATARQSAPPAPAVDGTMVRRQQELVLDVQRQLQDALRTVKVLSDGTDRAMSVVDQSHSHTRSSVHGVSSAGASTTKAATACCADSATCGPTRSQKSEQTGVNAPVSEDQTVWRWEGQSEEAPIWSDYRNGTGLASRDFRGLPAINDEECCLGVVKCDERGDIVD